MPDRTSLRRRRWTSSSVSRTCSAEDPSISGTHLLIIGRQVPTSYGGYIDLLALDADGRAHVLELKRDRTPRDVVAQALDYGSWVQGLGLSRISSKSTSTMTSGETHLGEAFAERFDSPLPDVVNAEQQFTIIASELDPTSDRIVEFLADVLRRAHQRRLLPPLQ